MTDEQKTPVSNGEPKPWERETLNKVLFASLNEQRRTRRWGIFFKLLFFVYLLTLLFIYLPEDLSGGSISLGKHTALVELSGVIADDSNASADHIITGLRAAFKDRNTAGIILRINSPGGSPVQAGYINDEIVRLRAKYPTVPLYAVITDICASGGYYVAAAADKIYADKASIVGSIGVLMDGFGFVGTMEKLGVERRLLAAGDHKGFLDPFSPVKQGDVAHVEGMLKDIHRQFIATVKKGRGTRLKESDTLYSGLVWTGEQGVEMGLVDALGSSSYVARDVIGAEDIVDFTPRANYLDRFAERIGLALGKSVLSSTSAWTGLK
ncbi:MAG: S49 family peptidase [Gammaproteobacteria bacterium]|nr:S49 family peptidase [Gammaproteobacteria bacterium]